MKKVNLLKKSRVVGIIVLFICASFVSSGYSEEINQIDTEVADVCELQDNVVVTCSTFGFPGEPSQEITMPLNEAEFLYDKIKDLQIEVARDPISDKIQQLQHEIITLADEHNLLPAGLSVETLKSRFNPSWTIQNRRLGILPLQNKASELFCTFVSAGSGGVFPIIVLPRLIPIIMTPIPRLFMIWNADEAITSCGGLLSETGFIAYGQQKGIALGFWGIGFTFSLPPFMGVYGLAGYALFARVNAEHIEYYPPNYPPEINAFYPLDGAQNIPISTSELSFHISDPEKELMSYAVTTDPDIGSGNGNLKPDGIYSVPISGLEGSEEYTWHAQVSDGENLVDSTFTFTTEPVAPIVYDPTPEDGARYVSVDLSQLSFKLKDYQGDLMDYTVETVPNIGSGSGTGVGDGTYSVDISGLDYSTEYTWYVNATDGTYWKHKVFDFQAEHKMVFDPFDEGWQYRKQITIDHTKVTGDLTNFPILISTTDSDLRDKAQDDGDDILFMDDPGVANRLYHEIEQFDESSGELICWVNVTNVASDDDTEFYIYYGNPGSCNQQAPELVWDPKFVGVWHMGESSGNIIDSTGTKDGVVVGSPDYQENGKIGNCIYFDGVNVEYFDIVDETYKFNTEDVTLEIWVYFVENRNMNEPPIYFGDNYNVPSLAIHKERSEGPSGSAGKLFAHNRYDQTGDIAWSAEGGETHVGHWIYLVGRFERGVETSLWINGQKEPYAANTCHNNNLNGASQFLARIGRAGVGGGSYMPNSAHIYLDEVRVSKNMARSGAWLSTSYNNQDGSSSFLSFGLEETGS